MIDIPPVRLPMRLFDYKVVCPNDVARRFPPIIGRGRGLRLSKEMIEEARRKLRKRQLTKAADGT